MKRLCVIVIALLLMCSAAFAEVDLSGMSYEELSELRDQVNQAILASDGWQVVIASREFGFHFPVTQKPSPDKYTWYIRDYVGKNVASLVASMRDSQVDFFYFGGGLRINWLNVDGSYMDIEDEELMKQYVVIGQDLAPNTELKLIFGKDSDGKETSRAENQNYSMITLYVAKIAAK